MAAECSTLCSLHISIAAYLWLWHSSHIAMATNNPNYLESQSANMSPWTLSVWRWVVAKNGFGRRTIAYGSTRHSTTIATCDDDGWAPAVESILDDDKLRFLHCRMKAFFLESKFSRPLSFAKWIIDFSRGRKIFSSKKAAVMVWWISPEFPVRNAITSIEFPSSM